MSLIVDIQLRCLFMVSNGIWIRALFAGVNELCKTRRLVRFMKIRTIFIASLKFYIGQTVLNLLISLKLLV